MALPPPKPHPPVVQRLRPSPSQVFPPSQDMAQLCPGIQEEISLAHLAILMGSWSPGLRRRLSPCSGNPLSVSPGAGLLAPTCLKKHWCLCSGRSLQGGRYDPSRGPPLALGRPHLSVRPMCEGRLRLWGDETSGVDHGGPTSCGMSTQTSSFSKCVTSSKRPS